MNERVRIQRKGFGGSWLPDGVAWVNVLSKADHFVIIIQKRIGQAFDYLFTWRGLSLRVTACNTDHSNPRYWLLHCEVV